MTNSNYSHINNSGDIDLGRLIRIILMQSKLILVLTITGISIATLYYINATKTYKISSTLQIFTSQPASYGAESSIDFVLGSSSRYDITNLLILYKTRSNILKIIEELQLNIYIDGLDRNEVIDINELSLTSKDDYASKNINVVFNNNNYDLFDNDKKIATYDYDVLHEVDGIKINLSKSNLPNQKFVSIKVVKPESLFKTYKNKIDLQSSVDNKNFWRGSGIITSSLVTNDIEEGRKIINLANDIFIKQNIETEKEQARKAIAFIDQRIDSLQNIMDLNKLKLKDFQEKNTSLNVDLEIESIIKSISEIESEINKIELEIAKAENTYTKTNPVFLGYINQRNALVNQKDIIESKIRELPLAQQEYIDLYRDVEISQDLYSELVNRKLGFSIMEASTIGNIRVVDEAYQDFRVSPKPFMLIFSVFFTFFASIFVALVRGLYFLPISNPAEIQDSNIDAPIVGVTPYVELMDESNERLLQSLESLILAIKSIEKIDKDNASIILITSPTAANGKSFISRSIATKLSELGHKTLLVDNDLKRGSQHKFYEIKSISEKEFLSINEENLDNYNISENLYLIPKISRLSSSFKFLYSLGYKNKIEEFKEKFDYIIFDTAPILSVSDTSILMSYSDANMIVARHGLTKINELKQAIQTSGQTGLSFDGIIYNSYEKPASYYGYYGLYGNYAYQYYANKYLYESYDYKNNED